MGPTRRAAVRTSQTRRRRRGRSGAVRAAARHAHCGRVETANKHHRTCAPHMCSGRTECPPRRRCRLRFVCACKRLGRACTGTSRVARARAAARQLLTSQAAVRGVPRGSTRRCRRRSRAPRASSRAPAPREERAARSARAGAVEEGAQLHVAGTSCCKLSYSPTPWASYAVSVPAVCGAAARASPACRAPRQSGVPCCHSLRGVRASSRRARAGQRSTRVHWAQQVSRHPNVAPHIADAAAAPLP